MADENRLSVVVTHADGQTTRWGPDEWDARNIPQGISFSSGAPGGFREASLSLPRAIDVDYADLTLLDTLTILGPGGKVAWEGRIQQFPRRHSDTSEIAIGAVGWGAHLKDDPTVQLVGCDRRADAWTEPPQARRLQIVGAGNPFGTDYVVEVDARSIRFDGASRKEIENGSTVEIWYYAPAGTELARGTVTMVDTNTGNTETARWHLTDNDDGSSADTYNQTGGALDTNNFSPTRRYAYMSLQSTGVHTKAGGSSTHRTVKQIAVYGDHEMTLTDDPDGVEPDGLMASEIIKYVVGRWAPLLDTDIEGSSVWLPHFVIDDPINAEEAIVRANYADLYEWGVWENKTFFYRRPDPLRLCWDVRLSEGASVDLEGDVADEVYNGVIVSYTEPKGEAKTLGPLGSGCDDEDSALSDSEPTNPVNSHGLTRWAPLAISATTTKQAALELGTFYLAEKAKPQRRGSITVDGTIRHPDGATRPTWQVRAGDWVRIGDHPNDEPRRIIEASWSGGAVTMTLDNSAHRVESFMEAFGQALIGKVG